MVFSSVTVPSYVGSVAVVEPAAVPWRGRRTVLVRPGVHVGVDAVGGADLVLDPGLLDLHALLGLEGGLLGTRGLGAGDLGPSGLLVGLAARGLDGGGALGGLGAQLSASLTLGGGALVAHECDGDADRRSRR